MDRAWICGSNAIGAAAQAVNFDMLELAALKRYKKFYKLRTRVHSNKAELVLAVAKHFETNEVDEQDTIEVFLDSLRK